MSQQAWMVSKTILAVPEMTRPVFRMGNTGLFYQKPGKLPHIGQKTERKSKRNMALEFLWQGLLSVTWRQVVMYAIGGLLIWLALEKGFEPALLLPMGFGAILVNLPMSGVINQTSAGVGETTGIIQWLFEVGIEVSEAFPLLLFIGIGAMIDFGPLLANPKLFLCGAAAQAGIFLTILLAAVLGFDIRDAASIGIIGAADGPTSLLVSQTLHSNYVGAIAVAAYSYMALVPIIQPFAIKLVTTKEDRAMQMPYQPKNVSKRLRILFPIFVSIIAGLVAPSSVALVGFLMFGNLIRECGVLTSLYRTAQNELTNLITLLLGISISFSMRADQFVQPATLMILVLGLVAFVLDSMVGVLFVKLMNLFTPNNKVNPMVGAAGISAFPMSARVIERLGQEEDKQNHLLMHAIAANVSGQIASVVAGGVVLQYFANMS
jgi:oxaloacetate decarboxylase beta subunit